jgi:hypothetical protein
MHALIVTVRGGGVPHDGGEHGDDDDGESREGDDLDEDVDALTTVVAGDEDAAAYDTDHVASPTPYRGPPYLYGLFPYVHDHAGRALVVPAHAYLAPSERAPHRPARSSGGPSNHSWELNESLRSPCQPPSSSHSASRTHWASG